ncbi:MAG: hypothetical protein WC565_08285 [Parcubacteria group bacterium]
MNAREKVLQLYGKKDGSTWKWLTKREEEDIRVAAGVSLAETGTGDVEVRASEAGTSVAIYVVGRELSKKVAYVMVPDGDESDPVVRKAMERIEGKADEARQIVEQMRKEIRPNE